jgi:leader peptidase (prepilin peptidase)/N-methyltransferase
LPDSSLYPIFMGFVFLLGLSIGSFLNVVGLRFLAEESIRFPASHCPHCQALLRPIDNIPVLSYLLLGGRCRSCKADISLQYPLIELATALLFCLTFWRFGVSFQTLFLLFLLSNLIVIFITDLREKLIFEINSLSLIPVGLLYNALSLGPIKTAFPLDLGAIVLYVPDALISAVIAIAIVFIFFEGLIFLSNLVFGTEGFGHGDTHLMMGAGAFLGWPLTVLALLLGFIIQTIPAIPMLVIGWIRNKQYTSLAAGAAAMFFGGLPLILMHLPMPVSLQSGLSLLSLLFSLVALGVFLKQIKNSESYTYLPLGPALVIGIIVALFWGHPIILAYQTFMIHHA